MTKLYIVSFIISMLLTCGLLLYISICHEDNIAQLANARLFVSIS